MRITLKAVNAELQRRGYNALLTNAAGYFYFRGGEAADWLDRTVRVPRIGDLSVEQWVQQFLQLRRRNQEIMRTGRKPPGGARRAGR